MIRLFVVLVFVALVCGGCSELLYSVKSSVIEVPGVGIVRTNTWSNGEETAIIAIQNSFRRKQEWAEDDLRFIVVKEKTAWQLMTVLYTSSADRRGIEVRVSDLDDADGRRQEWLARYKKFLEATKGGFS